MIAHRLRGALPALGCAALALAFQQVDRLPDNLDRLHEPGFAAFWIARELMPALVVAAVVLVVLRLASRDTGSLARRPLRFALLVAGGGALGVACAWALALAGGWLPAPGSAGFDWTVLYEAWSATVLWGGLAGWLYVLLRSRVAEGDRLALLLARRALVARQLAQSRLAATRAQVDPALLVDVLRESRRRHLDADADAIALLDALVHALRLALDAGAADAAAGSPQRRRTVAWIELVALRHGLAVQRNGDEFVLTGPALGPALAATLGDWARGQPGILRHVATAEPAPAHVLHVAP